jgi:hypothetical protein
MELDNYYWIRYDNGWHIGYYEFDDEYEKPQWIVNGMGMLVEPLEVGDKIVRREKDSTSKRQSNIPAVIARYFFRALALPFFIIISLIGAIRWWTSFIVDYIRWGGEAIKYTKRRNIKTIEDVFDKVRDNVI